MTADPSASRDRPAPQKLPRRTRQSTFSSADKVPIQSVVRAFSVLEILARRPAGVSLTDLSRMVGLHKATVHRLVRTMVLLGYVAQTAEGEPYRVSGQLLEGNSRATLSPTELESLQRVASGLANFIPPKHRDLLESMDLISVSRRGEFHLTEDGRRQLGRSGAGKPREPRAAIAEARE